MAIFKSMFKKTGYIKIGSQPEEKGPSVPDGMWLKCSKCKKMVGFLYYFLLVKKTQKEYKILHRFLINDMVCCTVQAAIFI